MQFLNNIFHRVSIVCLVCVSLPLSAADNILIEDNAADVAFVRSSGTGERHEQEVTDLAYGTSLYHLFQNEKLAAITDITVARDKAAFKNNPDDAELLLAVLYFDYGLSEEAGKIFNRLLDESVSESVRNKVWFNLARVQYEINNFKQAEELLLRINEKLSPRREAEKQYIRSSLLIRKKSYIEAEKAVSSIQSEHLWLAYSEFNLGLALTADTGAENGFQWLKKLLSRSANDQELLSLQDAGRLVLGLSLLKQNQLDEAIKYFEEVRVSSALSNKALLATGWAWSRKSDPQKALTYWRVLTDKGQSDDATLEAHLATAYAYEQLNNKTVAAEHYAISVELFEQHLIAMDEFISSIRKKDLISRLYGNSDDNNSVASEPTDKKSSEAVPDYTDMPYIQHIVASKSFQQALQNYDELIVIRRSLSQWKNNLPTLELMLAERKKSFENKRPLVEQTTDFKQLKNLKQQRKRLAQEVNRISEKQDAMALANEDEAEYLEQLEEVEILISKLASSKDLSEEKEKYRLLYGLLYWDINVDYPRRSWQLFYQMQLLNRAIDAAESSALSLKKAAAVNEKRLFDFSRRIIGQDLEVQRNEVKVSRLLDQQTRLINQLVIQAIEDRQQKIVELRLNARYSLARVHDEMSKQQGLR